MTKEATTKAPRGEQFTAYIHGEIKRGASRLALKRDQSLSELISRLLLKELHRAGELKGVRISRGNRLVIEQSA
jgi:hypothetical protein